jgi:hypothetical protein
MRLKQKGHALVLVNWSLSNGNGSCHLPQQHRDMLLIYRLGPVWTGGVSSASLVSEFEQITEAPKLNSYEFLLVLTR